MTPDDPIADVQFVFISNNQPPKAQCAPDHVCEYLLYCLPSSPQTPCDPLNFTITDNNNHVVLSTIPLWPIIISLTASLFSLRPLLKCIINPPPMVQCDTDNLFECLHHSQSHSPQTPYDPYHPFSSPNKHLESLTNPLRPNVILIIYLYVYIIVSLIPLIPL